MSTVRQIAIIESDNHQAVVLYRKFNIVDSCLMLSSRNIERKSQVIIQGHVNNASEKKCKTKATILQGNLFNLVLIKCKKITPITPHINKARQNEIRQTS